MTTLQLLASIAAALLLQLTFGIGLAVWRRRDRANSSPGSTAAPALRTMAGAWPGWREFRVARCVFEDAGRRQCSFYLEPVDGVPLAAFKPGQYLTFSLQIAGPVAGTPEARRSITRCYSLSNRPQRQSYRVTIKRAMPPGLASGHFHDRVHEGDILQVKAPSGQFFIDPDPATPVVLIAGGIGITPMMSMLRWCLDEQPQRTVHLYYGIRNRGEQAFEQALDDLACAHPNFHLNVVLSAAEPQKMQGRGHEHKGHVDIELLRRTLPHGRHQFYVCGPPLMMASLVPALRSWGVLAEDLRYEAFGPASMPPADLLVAPLGSALPLEIRFSRAGRTLTWDGQDANLLDFAERHGVEVDSGCRSGSCGSCETRLVSGTVRYGNRPDHDIAPGCCLLCVAVPEAALVLEA